MADPFVDFKDKVADMAKYHGVESFAVVWTTEDEVGHYVESDGNACELMGLMDNLKFEMQMEDHNKKLMGHGETNDT